MTKLLKHIQLSIFAFIQILKKSYENEIILTEQNISLKWCRPLELLIYIGKGFRSLHTVDMEFVGQRAVKLLPIKVGS